MNRRTIIQTSVILVCVAIILIALAFLKIYLNGRLMPRTYLLGSNIGLSTQDEVKTFLNEKENLIKEKKYKVVLDNKEEMMSIDEMGVSINYGQTQQQTPVFNASKDSFDKPVASLVLGSQMPIIVNLDKQKFVDNVDTKFNFKDEKTQDAKVAFNEQKQMIFVAEKPGKIVETSNLKEKLEALINQEQTELKLETKAQAPMLTAQDLEVQKEQLTSALTKNVKLQFEGQSWNFQPAEHTAEMEFKESHYLKLPWLSQKLPIVIKDSLPQSKDYELETKVEINFNSAIDEYLEKEIAEKVNKEMQTAKIYYDEKDQIVIEGTAENGQKISTEQLKKTIALSVNNGIGKANLPVNTVMAQVETDEKLKEMGVKELISVGYTTYHGSPNNRVHNINVGMEKFNGTYIKKGEEFSFNTILGPVEAYTGYLPELVIKGDQGTIPEYGGGLCQVSSTAYRAALFSGLPITERAPHSYAVSYYAQVLGYGLDATIYPGVRDFKFVNDTPGDIIVQAYTDGGQAYFKFYGTSDGRSVKLEGPYTTNKRGIPAPEIITSASLPAGVRQQKENGHAGFDTTWYRYLTKDGTTAKETIFSNYRAVPPKVIVGAGAAPEAENSAPATGDTAEFSS